MIFIDTNVLMYAYDRGSRFHDRARTWLESLLSGEDDVGLPWASVLGFLRLSTDTRLLTRPLSTEESSAVVNVWATHARVSFISPGPRHWTILQTLLSSAQIRGPLVSDAHVAALAIEHGATLATNDRDFSRFEGLRVIYPLAD